MGGWKKQKMEMEERINAKTLMLTIENKELKRRMVEWIALQKECKELKKKEGWYETKHQCQKIIIDYKHKKGGLNKEKGFWQQEQKTKENAIEKMLIQILHMKSMITVKEFCR